MTREKGMEGEKSLEMVKIERNLTGQLPKTGSKTPRSYH